MATAQELAAAGALVNLITYVDLEEYEQPLRQVYADPRAIEWMTKILPHFVPINHQQDDLLPWQQADNYMHDFIVGVTEFEMAPHFMLPVESGIWELRTPDLRFFGWFWKKATFILSSIEKKEACAAINGLASGHRNQSVRIRESLKLDPPKFVPGSSLKDVL
jgi:hypothetical protein